MSRLLVVDDAVVRLYRGGGDGTELLAQLPCEAFVERAAELLAPGATVCLLLLAGQLESERIVVPELSRLERARFLCARENLRGTVLGSVLQQDRFTVLRKVSAGDAVLAVWDSLVRLDVIVGYAAHAQQWLERAHRLHPGAPDPCFISGQRGGSTELALLCAGRVLWVRRLSEEGADAAVVEQTADFLRAQGLLDRDAQPPLLDVGGMPDQLDSPAALCAVLAGAGDLRPERLRRRARRRRGSAVALAAALCFSAGVSTFVAARVSSATPAPAQRAAGLAAPSAEAFSALDERRWLQSVSARWMGLSNHTFVGGLIALSALTDAGSGLAIERAEGWSDPVDGTVRWSIRGTLARSALTDSTWSDALEALARPGWIVDVQRAPQVMSTAASAARQPFDIAVEVPPVPVQ